MFCEHMHVTTAVENFFSVFFLFLLLFSQGLTNYSQWAKSGPSSLFVCVLKAESGFTFTSLQFMYRKHKSGRKVKKRFLNKEDPGV